jgi:hypothetical protein
LGLVGLLALKLVQVLELAEETQYYQQSLLMVAEAAALGTPQAQTVVLVVLVVALVARGIQVGQVIHLLHPLMAAMVRLQPQVKVETGAIRLRALMMPVVAVVQEALEAMGSMEPQEMGAVEHPQQLQVLLQLMPVEVGLEVAAEQEALEVPVVGGTVKMVLTL